MKLRYILIASLLCLIFGVFIDGQNGSSAQNLANQVLGLDTANQPIAEAQKSLSDYAGRHMGASTSIFLAGAYGRATTTVSIAPTTSGQVYHDAQAACVSHTTAVVQANCVQAYVNSHTTPGASTTQPAQLSKIPYTFSYTSPRWTPDPAGILLAIGLLGLLVASGIYLVRLGPKFGYTKSE